MNQRIGFQQVINRLKTIKSSYSIKKQFLIEIRQASKVQTENSWILHIQIVKRNKTMKQDRYHLFIHTDQFFSNFLLLYGFKRIFKMIEYHLQLNKMNFVPHGLWKKMSSSKSSSQANHSTDSRKLALSPKSIGFDMIKQTKKQTELNVSDYLLSIQKHSPILNQQKQRKCSLSYQFQQSMQIIPHKNEALSNNQLKQKFVQAKLQKIQNQSIVQEQYDFKSTKKKQINFLSLYESFGMDLNTTPQSKVNKSQLKGKQFTSKRSALQASLCQLRNLRNYCFQIQDLLVNIRENFGKQLSDLNKQFEKKLKQSDQRSKLQSLRMQIEFLQKENQQIWSKYESMCDQNEQLKKRSENKDLQIHKKQSIKLRSINIQLQEKYNIAFQQNQILNRQKNAITKQMSLLSEKVFRLDLQLKQKNDIERASRQKCEYTEAKYHELLMRLTQLQEEIKQRESLNREYSHSNSKPKLQFNARMPLVRMQESYQFASPLQRLTSPHYQPERDKQFANLRKKVTNKPGKSYPNSFIQQRITNRKLQTQRDKSMLPPKNQKSIIANQSFQNLLIKQRSSSETFKTLLSQKSTNSFNSNFAVNKTLTINRFCQSRNQAQDASSKQKIRQLHSNIDRLRLNLKNQISLLK